jgi:hypothetical protein
MCVCVCLCYKKHRVSLRDISPPIDIDKFKVPKLRPESRGKACQIYLIELRLSSRTKTSLILDKGLGIYCMVPASPLQGQMQVHPEEQLSRSTWTIFSSPTSIGNLFN